MNKLFSHGTVATGLDKGCAYTHTDNRTFAGGAIKQKVLVKNITIGERRSHDGVVNDASREYILAIESWY